MADDIATWLSNADRMIAAGERFDPPTLTALLAVVKAAQAVLNFTEQDHQAIRDLWPDDDIAADRRKWPLSPTMRQTKALADALDALTRPPQGAGG